MKKRVLAGAMACALLLGAGAYAEEGFDAQERIDHLLSHGKRAVFSCSGNLVKLRIAPAANRMNGRMAEGDEFTILDAFGEWVHVEVVDVPPDKKEARRGMTGWIHAENIACACDMEEAEDEAAAAQ